MGQNRKMNDTSSGINPKIFLLLYCTVPEID
jgi:hypothetical protein